MEKTVTRKPFQGVWNILRFNWHFYAMAMLLLAATFFFAIDPVFLKAVRYLIVLPLLISLLVSCYVYDFKGFYSFAWLRQFNFQPKRIVNINAGFDETSAILSQQFPDAELKVLDFYDPEKHTEVSIGRARKAYPPFPGTLSVQTQKMMLEDHSVDCIFLIFAAHEIRQERERISFFKELERILDFDGRMILIEHLRDFPNFFAYTVGFFHFYSKKNWQSILRKSNLSIESEHKLSPFTSIFIITKNGNPS